ncbi:hypothetical protein EWM64_g5210 [Hericium alpestre]|uniref:AB hydrolase-1 domain-containing protein n=1 Tax=Hericium alpestre TaxID=135208 RepID=A0A4Y9ZW65_9AGAM|nr:hypothetical protein EWM64_g5210 [Hericium alpestre]
MSYSFHQSHLEQSEPVLVKAAFTLQYHLDKEPLHYVATRFTWPARSNSRSHLPAVSLLVTSGVGLTSDLWAPVVQRLYQLQQQPDSPFCIISVWAVDRPTHGDAAVLNEASLKRYEGLCASTHYITALGAFLTSNVLTDQERNNLIGLGHSAGTGPLILQIAKDLQWNPYRSLILVEPPLFEPETKPTFDGLIRKIHVLNMRRPRSFKSPELAMQFVTSHGPWKYFHPEVLRIATETFFKPAPTDSGCNKVMTKTPPPEETAAFDDFPGVLETVNRVLGFWPKPLAASLANIIDENRSALASVSIVEGATHYVPQEKPEELANTVFRAIRNSTMRSQARL